MNIEEAVRKLKSQLDANAGIPAKSARELWNELDLSDEDREKLAIEALATRVVREGRRRGMKHDFVELNYYIRHPNACATFLS